MERDRRGRRPHSHISRPLHLCRHATLPCRGGTLQAPTRRGSRSATKKCVKAGGADTPGARAERGAGSDAWLSWDNRGENAEQNNRYEYDCGQTNEPDFTSQRTPSGAPAHACLIVPTAKVSEPLPGGSKHVKALGTCKPESNLLCQPTPRFDRFQRQITAGAEADVCLAEQHARLPLCVDAGRTGVRTRESQGVSA